MGKDNTNQSNIVGSSAPKPEGRLVNDISWTKVQCTTASQSVHLNTECRFEFLRNVYFRISDVGFFRRGSASIIPHPRKLHEPSTPREGTKTNRKKYERENHRHERGGRVRCKMHCLLGFSLCFATRGCNKKGKKRRKCGTRKRTGAHKNCGETRI